MRCNSCRNEYDQKYFSFKNVAKNIRSRYCKACHAAYRKKHYLENRQKYIDKAARWNKNQGKILAKYLYGVLSQSCCVDCGERDIVVLDFDHTEKKLLGIAEMYQNRYSVEAVRREIEKCVVRCANCHRRKTALERGIWKLKMSRM